MNINEIANKIIEIICEMHGNPFDSVGLKSELRKDLGIDAVEAIYILERIAKEFKVEFTEIQWNRHFGSKAFFPFSLLFPGPRKNHIPITLQDIVDSVIAGQWTINYH